ncbi:hypothetical protein [Spirosoma aerolatum]|uniref:hypothetical protein n=1 Tax=Spirosoma aerolatum TaxID=1211326 RepID=UPI0009AC832E|nr:hypothetical protein [Spirosoma aerolatum]
MKSLFLLLSVILFVSGCQKDSVSSADDGTLPGQFRLEIDPIRCAMPTTQRLLVDQTGSSTYRFTYDRFGVGTYQLAGVKAVKSSSTAYELSVDGQSIGQYAVDEISTLRGPRKGWVLMVRHRLGETDGLEFMGMKE